MAVIINLGPFGADCCRNCESEFLFFFFYICCWFVYSVFGEGENISFSLICKSSLQDKEIQSLT